MSFVHQFIIGALKGLLTWLGGISLNDLLGESRNEKICLNNAIKVTSYRDKGYLFTILSLTVTHIFQADGITFVSLSVFSIYRLILLKEITDTLLYPSLWCLAPTIDRQIFDCPRRHHQAVLACACYHALSQCHFHLLVFFVRDILFVLIDVGLRLLWKRRGLP